MAKIVVKDQTIKTINKDGIDYICITDIAKQKNGEDPNGIIGNWMRNRNTIEFLGIWEELYNPNFNPIEFEGFRKEAGLNAFTMSPTKWVESTNAIGITAMSGRYGGRMPFLILLLNLHHGFPWNSNYILFANSNVSKWKSKNNWHGRLNVSCRR